MSGDPLPPARRWSGRRSVAAGVALLVALAIAGIAALTRDDATPDEPVDAAGEPPIATDEPVATEPPIATDEPVVTEPPVATDAPPDTESPATIPPVPATSPDPDATDRAEQYFDRTIEVYRRALPSGVDVVVRRSTGSYADLFGYGWRAPTGSAELCLPEYGLLMGRPGVMLPWGTAWIETPVSSEEIEDVTLLHRLDDDDGFTLLLVATDVDATELVVESPSGDELDRAPVAGGVAVLGLRSSDVREETPEQALVLLADGQPVATRSFAQAWRQWRERPAECRPPDPPRIGLPPAGEQPEDPAEADAEIRRRHALLVDRSIADDERPDDLLDDATGVAEARDEMNAGPFAESAAAAEYTIDGLVFTSPTEAWFEYTIDAPTGVFGERFGVARFDGSVWQITRATICQDLALAGGTCRPTPEPAAVVPPLPPDWDERWRAYTELASQYIAYDGCGPLGGC